jgi:adenine phosphoribosyltransferase
MTSAPAVVVERDGVDEGYEFRVYPFGELGTHIPSGLAREIVAALAESVSSNFGDVDSLLAPEPGGHTWGLATAVTVGKSLRIARMRETVSCVSRPLMRTTSYYSSQLFIDDIPRGERVLVIDDVISSGGTIRCLLDSLLASGTEVAGVQCIATKGNGWRSLDSSYQVPIRFLIQDDQYRSQRLDTASTEPSRIDGGRLIADRRR